MAEILETRLREKLHEIWASPTSEAVESAVPELLRMRIGYDSVELREETQSRHLALLENPDEFFWSRARHVSRPSLPMMRGLRPAWRLAAVGLAAAALVVIWMLARNFGTELDRNRLVETPPAPSKQAPEKPGPSDPKGPMVRIEPRRGASSPTQQEPPRKHDLPELLGPRFQVGEFVAVIGAPQWKLPGSKSSTPAMPYAALYAGATLTTGDTDKLEFKFADGSTVLMDFNTTVVLSPSQGDTAPPDEIEVTQGRVFVTVVPKPEKSQFAVRTDVATAEVLGTQFSLELEELNLLGTALTRRAKLQVKTGKVRFSNPYGSVVAPPQTESLAVEGFAPTAPKRLNVLKKFHLRDGHTLYVPTKHHDERFVEKRMATSGVELGLEAVDVPSRGVVVSGVRPRSPSDIAGLRVGDIVEAIDGAKVNRADDVLRPLVWRSPGAFTLRVRRNGVELNLQMLVRRRTDLPRIAKPLQLALDRVTQQAFIGSRAAAIADLKALARTSSHASVYNNLGLVWLVEDNMLEAILAFKEAVRLEPRVARFRLNLAHALRDIGNLQRAAEELETALQFDPASLDAARDLADVLSLQDRHAEALRTINACITRQPLDLRAWEWRGSFLLRMGETESAIESLRRALAIDPDSARAWYLLADAFHDTKRLEEAESAVRRSLSIDPTASHAYQLLGNLQFSRGRLRESEASYREALKSRPTDVGLLRSLAYVLEHAGKAIEALETYRMASGVEPRNPEIYMDIAFLLSNMGRGDEAFQVLAEGVSKAEESPQLLTNYGIELDKRGRTEEAKQAFETAIAFGEQVPQPHANLANIFLRLGDAAAAEAHLRQAIEMAPQDGVYLVQLGLLLRSLGRAAEAESRFEAALKLDVKNAWARFQIANHFQRSGRLVEAEREYRKTLELSPNDLEARTNLGNILAKTGRPSEAEAAFRDVIARSPRFIPARFNLAVHLMRHGRLAEAEAEFRRVLELDERNLAAYSGLSQSLVMLDRLPEALEWATKGVGIAPEDALMSHDLGWVHLKRGEFEDAERWLRRSLELHRNQLWKADTWVTLGEVFEAKKDIEAAKQAYRNALVLKPDSKEAAEALKRLGG